MRKLGIHNKNYLGCAELNKLLTEFELKKEHLDFLRKRHANDKINEYVIDDILNMSRYFNIAYGLPFAGYSLINSHLEKNYKHKMIDIVKYIEQIKIAKAGPEGDPESITVDLPMLLSEFKAYVGEIPKKQKICVENLLNAVITDVDSVSRFLEIFGRPRYFFQIFCNEVALVDKFKAKNEIAEELSEEQKAEFDKNQEIPRKVIELLKSYAYKTVKIDTSFS